MNREDSALLEVLGACIDAQVWARDIVDLRMAWMTCKRVDWMLWALKHINFHNDFKLRLYACACVRGTPLADGRTTWDLLTDERSRVAVDISERYANGTVSESERAAAGDAAWAAAGDAAGAAAGAAAGDAARDAAWAARAAAGAAAGDAAWAAWAAWAAAGDAEREWQTTKLLEILNGG